MAETIVAVIPLYNGVAYIKDAIESILAQERGPDEIVIVDDGSTDGGVGFNVASEFTDPRIKLLRKENGDQGSARNVAVANSESSLIAFLDQDDRWYPHHLRLLEEPFLGKNSIPLGWTYSNLDQVNDDGAMVCHNVLDTLSPNEHPKKTVNCCIRQDMLILPGASLISRDAYNSVGGFDTQFTGYEDDDLFLRLYLRGWRSAYINEALTVWRIHTASTSFSRKMAVSRMRYFEKLVRMFPDVPDMNRYYARDLLAPRFLRNVWGDLYNGLKKSDLERIALAKQHIWRLSSKLGISHCTKYRLASLLLSNPLVPLALRHLPRQAIRAARSMLRI